MLTRTSKLPELTTFLGDKPSGPRRMTWQEIYAVHRSIIAPIEAEAARKAAEAQPGRVPAKRRE